MDGLSFNGSSKTVFTLNYSLVVVAELRETGIFNHISNAVDEEEHSIEMHLPFIYKVFERYRQTYEIQHAVIKC